MPVIETATVPWTVVRDVPRERSVAILPVGAVEAHGPHLPLGTDVIIAEAMARAAAQRLDTRDWTVLLLPALPFAPAPFGAGFAGTLSVRADAVADIVAGVARSLAGHGVTLTAVANAHLDPAQRDVLRRVVEREGRRLVIPDIARRHHAARLGGEFATGACHAGRFESAIVLAERPELVVDDVRSALPPNPRSLSDAIAAGRSTFEEAGGPDAYFGWPADASAEEGRALVETLGDILAEAIEEAVT